MALLSTETLPLLSTVQEPEYPSINTDDIKHDTSTTQKGEITDNETRQINNHQQLSKNNLLGMVFVTIATFVMMTSNALLKYTSNHYHLSLFQVIITTNVLQHGIAWILWFLPSSITKKPDYIKLWYAEQEYRYSVWIRGVFYWCDLYLYWYGITLLPLGDAETIYFLCPIFVAFAARIFLKEQFSKAFPIIFAFTIIGLTILCQPKWLLRLFNPSDDDNEYNKLSVKGIVLLIAGCISWSCMSIMVRKAQKAHWIQLEIVSSLQAFAIWTPILVFINLFMPKQYNLDNGGFWHFSPEIVGFIIVIAVLTCTALMFMIIGYQFGEATKISWMEYTFLPFGFLYQWLMFSQRPNQYEIIGAFIVMSTCVFGVAEEYYNYKINSTEESVSITASNNTQESDDESLITASI